MRQILNTEFNYQEFFNSLDSFESTIKQMTVASQSAKEIDPEDFGELSELVGNLKEHLLKGEPFLAHKLYKKMLQYYVTGEEIQDVAFYNSQEVDYGQEPNNEIGIGQIFKEWSNDQGEQ